MTQRGHPRFLQDGGRTRRFQQHLHESYRVALVSRVVAQLSNLQAIHHLNNTWERLETVSTVPQPRLYQWLD
jgi:hypothetical protein